jgi:hypothetical protein
MEKRKAEGIEGDNLESEAIKLLVNNTHSIPVRLLSLSLFSRVDFGMLTFLLVLVDNEGGSTAPTTTLLSLPVSRCSCA